MKKPEIIRTVCALVQSEIEGVKIEHDPGQTVFILNGDMWKTQVVRVQWYVSPCISIQICSEQEANDDILNAIEEELGAMKVAYTFR